MNNNREMSTSEREMEDECDFKTIPIKKDRIKMWTNSALLMPRHFCSITVSKRDGKIFRELPNTHSLAPQETLSEEVINDHNTAIRLLMADKKFSEKDVFYRPELATNGLFLAKKLEYKPVIYGEYKIDVYKTTRDLDRILYRIGDDVLAKYVEPCWEDKNYTKVTLPAGFNIWVTDMPVRSPAFLKVHGAISARCRQDGENLFLEIIVFPHEIKCTPPTLAKFIEDLAVFHKYDYDPLALTKLINKDERDESLTKTYIREALLGLELSSPSFTITEVSTSTWPERWEEATVVFPDGDTLLLDNRKTASIIRRCRLNGDEQQGAVKKQLSIFSDYLERERLPFKLEENRLLDATLLELPKMQFAGDIQEQSVNGEWNVHKFYEGAKIKKWLVMYTEDVSLESLEPLITPMIRTARQKGMKLPKPIYSDTALKDTDSDEVISDQLLNAEKRYNFGMLFCNSESCWPDKLRVMAKRHGIAFMIMRMGNVAEKTILAAQKMNALNGGVCARVCDTKERQSGKDLHIGISYATVGEKIVAGLCAFSWRSLVERGFYENIEDLAVFLRECNRICKEKYEEKHDGEAPDRVYYYICRVKKRNILEAFENLKEDWDEKTLVTIVSVRPECNLKMFPITTHKAASSKAGGKKVPKTEPKQGDQTPEGSTTAVGTVVTIKKGVFLMCSYAPYFDTPQVFRYSIIKRGTEETDTEIQSLTLKLCHQHLVNISKKMPYIAFFADSKIMNEKKRHYRERFLEQRTEEIRKQSITSDAEEDNDSDGEWAANELQAHEEDAIDYFVDNWEQQTKEWTNSVFT